MERARIAPEREAGVTLNRRLGIEHIVALAVIVRLLHVLCVAPTPIFSYHLLFTDSDMRIFDIWARKIAAGDVLGREPYHYLAGWELALAPAEKWLEWFGREPTFYKAPFYAYLVALLYWAFGDPMWPLSLLQILASAASVYLLFRISEPLFGNMAALVAALFLALYGPAIHFDVVMLRGPWIVLGSLLFTWQLIKLQREPSARSARLLGVSAGVLILINEGFAPMGVLALLLIAIWVRSLPQLARILAWFGAGAGVVLAPVFVRNALVGAPVFKLAVTGGTAFALCNTASSSPYSFEVRGRAFLSAMDASNGELLATIGACLRSFSGPGAFIAFYLKRAAGLVIPFENPDNFNFYYAALKSPLLAVLPGYGLLLPLSLLGLALVVRRPQVLAPIVPAALSLFAAIMLTLPIARYRVTLAVYLMPLAGLALVRMAGWARERRFSRLALAAGALVLVSIGSTVLQARTVFAERPADTQLYRPVEFMLGVRFYVSQGRLAEASREALDLARLNSDPDTRITALLTVGDLEARQGHLAIAHETLTGIARLGASQPAVLMAVGDVYLSALKDRDQAEAAYRAAAQLPAPDALRDQIRERLERLKSAP
jgi:4-amino-4-deoxy-L-arabinose transferase-like glycosyltransferase